MVENTSWSRKTFLFFNYLFLLLLALICLFPIINVLAISFSSKTAAEAGLVTIWPVDFSTAAYEYVLSKKAFLTSFLVSVQRVTLGTAIQMAMIILVAYPLSKEVEKFRWRTLYVWVFFVTMLFSGGLIPLYMTVQKTGLLNSLWSLVLPNAIPVFSMVILLNFFRGLPKELEESAFIDGAGHFTTLWKIYLPLSKPALATLILFSMVMHWNSWFDGIIFMNNPENYPLQSYLKTVVVDQDLTAIEVGDSKLLEELSSRTFRAAQIFLGSLPILIVYPFLQKHFMKGIVLGSVKG